MRIENLPEFHINEFNKLKTFLSGLKFPLNQLSVNTNANANANTGINVSLYDAPRLKNNMVETIHLESVCVVQFYQKSSQLGMLKEGDFFSLSLHISQQAPMMTYLKMVKGVENDNGSILRSLGVAAGGTNKDNVTVACSKPIALEEMWKVFAAARLAIEKKAERVSSKNDLRLTFISLLSDHFDMNFASLTQSKKSAVSHSDADVDEMFNIPEIKQMQDAWKSKYGNSEGKIAKDLESSPEAKAVKESKELVESLMLEQKRIAEKLEKAKQEAKLADANFKAKKQNLEDSDTSKKKRENIDKMMAVAVKARDDYLKTHQEKISSEFNHPFIPHKVDLKSLDMAYDVFNKQLNPEAPKVKGTTRKRTLK